MQFNLNSRFLIDLQLFADEGGTGERTEQATPRRREEARKKGQVFKSSDLNAAVILLAGTAALYLSMNYIMESLSGFASLYISDRTLHDFSAEYVYSMFLEAFMLTGKVLLPVFLAVFITALLVTFLQVGFVFSSETLTPKLERLNPLAGFKRIFSKRALVELLKALFKIIVTGSIVYSVLQKYLYIFPRFVDMELAYSIKVLSVIVFEIAFKAGIAFLVIGIGDYLYQWLEHEKSLKMSKYDVKQEYKQTEGDPVVKSRQRQIQREAAMSRMMAEVLKADVVITNPTHYAVALRYTYQQMEAPVVVARGQGFIALKIKELARSNNVEIVENPPLARSLYFSTEIGDIIPEELYQAVAEVLAFVYKQKKKVL